MSLAATRLAYRNFRCEIQRDTGSVPDAGGQPGPPDWQPIAEHVPCRPWTSRAEEPADAAKSFVVEQRRVSLALGTDVTERDRIGDITTVQGATFFAGPHNILGVLRYTDHIELELEAVHG